jgi:hypothetical protein
LDKLLICAKAAFKQKLVIAIGSKRKVSLKGTQETLRLRGGFGGHDPIPQESGHVPRNRAVQLFGYAGEIQRANRMDFIWFGTPY